MGKYGKSEEGSEGKLGIGKYKEIKGRRLRDYFREEVGEMREGKVRRNNG